VPHADDPDGACLPCKRRGMEDQCEKPAYPARRPKAKRRIIKLDVSENAPGNGSSDSAFADSESLAGPSLPSASLQSQ
jgi:hypothetical protein